MVDMDAVVQSLWSKNNEVQIANAIGQQIGMIGSTLEHQIPELLFTNEEHPGEAGTKVKALAKASIEGQRIYQVTQENVNAVLPVLNISSEVKDEIRDSKAVGKKATVSQNNITVGGWTGVGYIITDPETGAGAYRISGGANGGFISDGIITFMKGALLTLALVGLLICAVLALFCAFLLLTLFLWIVGTILTSIVIIKSLLLISLGLVALGITCTGLVAGSGLVAAWFITSLRAAKITATILFVLTFLMDRGIIDPTSCQIAQARILSPKRKVKLDFSLRSLYA